MDNISNEQGLDVNQTSGDAQPTSVEGSSLSQGQGQVSIPEKFLVNGEPDYDRLTKSYLELEKKIGTKIGVSDPTEYDFKFQNEDSWNAEQFNDFKQKAVELGLSKEQFNFAMGVYEQNVQQLVESFTPSADKTTALLQQEWGKDFESNLTLAFNAFNAFAPEGIDVNDPAIGNNPSVIKLLSSIGRQMGEDSGINTNADVKGSGVSPLEIQEYMARPDYFTNKEVQKIVSEWYAQGNKL
jgi:hypothetical protein